MSTCQASSTHNSISIQMSAEAGWSWCTMPCILLRTSESLPCVGDLGSHWCRYFQTDSGKATGSLERESQLRDVANKGYSLLAALQGKYNTQLFSLPFESTRLPLTSSQRVAANNLQHQRGELERIVEASLIDSGISSIVSLTHTWQRKVASTLGLRRTP